jgi:hypothetical protein
MSQIDGLLSEYEKTVRQPWQRNLAGAQKVWFAVYDPTQERRLRFRLPDFEIVTKRAGHSWTAVDLTDAFARWMSAHDYREAYFEQPDLMDMALSEFAARVADEVRSVLTAPHIDESTVVAVYGLGSLFGLTRASALFEAVAPSIRGRLLAFFPGQHDGTNYRLLDARDGWNYLAVPITVTSGS